MMIKSTVRSIFLIAIMMVGCSKARSVNRDIDGSSISAVIPSPNQEFGDEGRNDIRRASVEQPRLESQQQVASSGSATPLTPIYVSPFVRSERIARATFEPQESSHAPPNYAPRPSGSIHPPTHSTARDLKTSASYGHHHGGGHHGYDHSGWLDMGAWTGGKGSFGWYADYPVGSKHGSHGYGR